MPLALIARQEPQFVPSRMKRESTPVRDRTRAKAKVDVRPATMVARARTLAKARADAPLTNPSTTQNVVISGCLTSQQKRGAAHSAPLADAENALIAGNAPQTETALLITDQLRSPITNHPSLLTSNSHPKNACQPV
jgi:hypothetical protein